MEGKKQNAPYHMFLQGILLLGYALLVLKFILNGTIHNFIAPRLQPYIVFTFISCILLGLIQCYRSLSDSLRVRDHVSHVLSPNRLNHHDHSHELNHGPACDCGHDHNHKPSSFVALLFLFPLVVGFIFSHHVIGTSVAENRGITFGQIGLNSSQVTRSRIKKPVVVPTASIKAMTSPKQSDSTLLKEIGTMQPPLDLNGGFDFDKLDQQIATKLLEMHTVQISKQKYAESLSAIDAQPSEFKGKPISIMGFVAREPGMNADQIVMSRFVITCCIADASVYGLMAESPTFKNLKKDQWVSIKGTLDVTTFKGKTIPIIHVTKATQIPQPKNPYVYNSVI